MRISDLIVFLGLVFVSFLSIAQKEFYIPIRSIDGKAIVMVDSLSFEPENLFSEFYIDSISKEPYTGFGIRTFGENAMDTLEIVNGLKNGWQKRYFSFKNKEGSYLGELDYFNQAEKIWLSNHFNAVLKWNKSSSFIKYLTTEKVYSFEVVYKSSGKIIIKQRVRDERGVAKKRFKMNSLEELDCFFSHHRLIYKYCKQAGFFGKAEIE